MARGAGPHPQAHGVCDDASDVRPRGRAPERSGDRCGPGCGPRRPWPGCRAGGRTPCPGAARAHGTAGVGRRDVPEHVRRAVHESAAVNALGGVDPARRAARRVRTVVRRLRPVPRVRGTPALRCVPWTVDRKTCCARTGRTAGPAGTRNPTTDEAYTLRPERGRDPRSGPRPPARRPRAAGTGMANTGSLAYGGIRSSTRPLPVAAAHQEIPDRRPCALVRRAPAGGPSGCPAPSPNARVGGPATAALPAPRPAP